MKNNNNNINDEKIIDSSQNLKFISSLSSLPSFMLKWIEQNSNEIIAVWDYKGKLLFISKSVERLLGYTLAELMHVSWRDILYQDDASYIKEHFDHNKTSTQTFNLHIRNKNEKNIWCECNIAKLKDEVIKKTYYISTIKDISDKKEAEEMMIRSEKMSIAGQLAAGIAHEIRNPLTSLKGFLQLLQAGVNRKDVYYKIMIDEIEKIETITSELLFISKPLTDHKQKESVKEMVNDVIELLKPQAKLKNIVLVLEEEGDNFIYCDRSQIKQVLINIVKNAIEAMDNPGTIKINMEHKDSDLLINIIDEGPGIDEDIIHKLGEPFFTTKQNGTGLGLMITKQILERHGASMEITHNKCNGSTFRIIFPLT